MLAKRFLLLRLGCIVAIAANALAAGGACPCGGSTSIDNPSPATDTTADWCTNQQSCCTQDRTTSCCGSPAPVTDLQKTGSTKGSACGCTGDDTCSCIHQVPLVPAETAPVQIDPPINQSRSAHLCNGTSSATMPTGARVHEASPIVLPYSSHLYDLFHHLLI
jgi:hypothetical protein